MSEKIKTAKAMEKIGKEIKNASISNNVKSLQSAGTLFKLERPLCETRDSTSRPEVVLVENILQNEPVQRQDISEQLYQTNKDESDFADR